MARRRSFSAATLTRLRELPASDALALLTTHARLDPTYVPIKDDHSRRWHVCTARGEFEILTTLITSPGRVFSRNQLLDAVWGSSDFREPRTVDVHVRHLREKIEQDPAAPVRIQTVRGVGYRFEG